MGPRRATGVKCAAQMGGDGTGGRGFGVHGREASAAGRHAQAAERVLFYCERSEAIYSFFAGEMDCFAALATTVIDFGYAPPWRPEAAQRASRCGRSLVPKCVNW